MIFQASDYKRTKFLDSNNNNNLFIKSIYLKVGTQLEYFGHSNMLYIYAIRAITNHIPIRECSFLRNLSLICTENI